MNLNTKDIALLRLLYACDNGLTGDMLAHHGHGAETLRRLVRAKFVSATVETMAVPKGMKRTRYRITPAGKAAVAKVK